MRPTMAFTVYLLVVFVGGALLAPWVWHGTQALAAGSGAEWLSALARQPFHRYVHRCLLLLAVGGLWPLARALGCRGWAGLGLSPFEPAWRLWTRGAGLGFVMFTGVMAVEMVAGLRAWQAARTSGEWLGLVTRAGVTSLVVGTLEEVMFRGVLCGGLKRAAGWWPAILWSGVIYSMVHFLQRPASPGFVAWNTGLKALSQMLVGFEAMDGVLAGFFTLFLGGVLLGVMYRETGTLFYSMGLHSGWVFWMKLRGWLTRSLNPDQSGIPAMLVSNGLNLIIIGLVLVIVLKTSRKTGGRRRTEREGGSELEQGEKDI